MEEEQEEEIVENRPGKEPRREEQVSRNEVDEEHEQDRKRRNPRGRKLKLEIRKNVENRVWDHLSINAERMTPDFECSQGLAVLPTPG